MAPAIKNVEIEIGIVVCPVFNASRYITTTPEVRQGVTIQNCQVILRLVMLAHSPNYIIYLVQSEFSS